MPTATKCLRCRKVHQKCEPKDRYIWDLCSRCRLRNFDCSLAIVIFDLRSYDVPLIFAPLPGGTVRDDKDLLKELDFLTYLLSHTQDFSMAEWLEVPDKVLYYTSQIEERYDAWAPNMYLLRKCAHNALQRLNNEIQAAIHAHTANGEFKKAEH